MQSRCSISSTLASRPLPPSLDPPRHTCRLTLPSGTSARSTLARHPPAVGQSYAACMYPTGALYRQNDTIST
eukprot:scaffold124660_cov27-Phaeocystis_antarctica.AAC.1